MEEMKPMHQVKKSQIDTAMRKIMPDMVIRNITIVDVFSLDTYIADIVIHDGHFTAIGEYPEPAKQVIDGSGKMIIPGFIDAHVHIESSMVTPVGYANAVLPHGVTSIVTDPHEIANVGGVEGIEFMIHAAQHVPLDIHFMLPSCVPATQFEQGAHVLHADQLRPLYQHNDVHGLAEVMNFPSVISGDDDMLNKIEDAISRGHVVDGHCAGFTTDMLNAYACAGIRTDHEATSADDLIDRTRRGIHTQIRRGTVCRDLPHLIPVVNERNHRLLSFSTDDKHLDDLLTTGGVNANVKESIAMGLDPIIAVSMGSYNTALCYGFKNKGAIAPGYLADFSIIDNLQDMHFESVYKAGRLIAQNGQMIDPSTNEKIHASDHLTDSIHTGEITAQHLQIHLGTHHLAHIIGVTHGGVVTDKIIGEVNVDTDGNFVPSLERDQLKVAVIDRHKKTGNVGLGILKGLRLQRGAIATTIAHDSHNIITAGTNDEDILMAVKALHKIDGGIVMVDDGEIVAQISLEICGLMSRRPNESILHDLHQLKVQIKRMAPNLDFNPFLTLSFMSLVVIPQLKVCDRGLFDFDAFDFIDIAAKDSIQSHSHIAG